MSCNCIVQCSYICSSSTQTIHDWILALLVLLLVGIDVIILTIFVVIEGVRGRLGAREVPDREVPESIIGVSRWLYTWVY